MSELMETRSRLKKTIITILIVFILIFSTSCYVSSNEAEEESLPEVVRKGNLSDIDEKVKIEDDAIVAAAKSDEPSQKDTLEIFSEEVVRPDLFVQQNSDEVINTEFVSCGLININYSNDENKKLKLQVIKGEKNIAYNLFGTGEVESFSLQFGSGEYTIRILENVKDDQYTIIESKVVEVEIEDDLGVFLHSIQNVDWNYEKKPIQDVPVLVVNALEKNNDSIIAECLSDLYFFITKNIEYDYEKFSGLDYTYLPDIETTYEIKTGICYDYSSLLASMLRSIGVPTKLVTGYSANYPETYHAWVEVYIDERWIILDPTFDASDKGLFKIKNAEKNTDEYIKVYEY